jgi:hypothetical protein
VNPPRRRGPHGVRATGLARTAYRRRMLTCSPAWRFRCSARDDVDGRGGYPSNSVAVTTRSPRRASRGWTRMRRVGVQPARSSGCPRVRAAALRGAGAGGWLAQHVDRPAAPLGADGNPQIPASGEVDGCERQGHRCAEAQFWNELRLGPAIKGVPPCPSDSTTSHRRFSAGAAGAAIGPTSAG